MKMIAFVSFYELRV